MNIWVRLLTALGCAMLIIAATSQAGGEVGRLFGGHLLSGHGVPPAEARAALAPDGDRAGESPNVIVVFTDDQHWDSLDFMPYLRDVVMPQATDFTNAFATTPLCCPSRVSMMTGLYTFNHGVRFNSGPLGGFDAFDDSQTVATALQAGSDYETYYLGKYLNGYTASTPYVPPGWDHWLAFNNRGATAQFFYDYWLNEDGASVYYGVEPADYSTDVLRDHAADLIAAAGDTPYVMYLSIYAPHAPAIPAERHEGAYTGILPHRPPNFDEADISDKPAWLAELEPFDYAALDEYRERQLETLLAVDEAIEGIFAALDSAGQLDNTVVIFTSDNGYAWGEHRVIGKWCPYEACLRIPFVVWYPSLTAGEENDAFVLNIDLVPTIADLAGVDVAGSVDGLSLLPLLDGSSASLRDDFLFELWGKEDTQAWARIVPTYAGIRTAEWKFVALGTGERELYNLVEDPYELQNLASLPEYEGLMADFTQRIREIRDSPTIPPLPTE